MSRATPPRPKKTRNWPSDNEALKRRGSRTIWFDPAMIWEAAPTGMLPTENATEAIRSPGVRQVDVASGVGSAPGLKDPARIAAFVAAAG